MNEIRKWLEGIGLGQYADAFEANDIDINLLAELDDANLKDSGLSSAGHRIRIRKAIAGLASMAATEPQSKPTPSQTEPTATSAERRQLTVMFCDLVGSTELSSKLDPEDMRTIIGAYHRCCTELVQQIGGFVAKYMGDGILVYFGYPQAHEHDAEQAVRTGLALVDAVPKLPTAGSPLQIRVGIATGMVVWANWLGRSAGARDSWRDPERCGSAASDRSEPNKVIIADDTRKLVGNLFELEELGGVGLKGIGARGGERRGGAVHSRGRSVTCLGSPGEPVRVAYGAARPLRPFKELAQIGAAIGREFSHALMAAVLRKPKLSSHRDLIASWRPVCCSSKACHRMRLTCSSMPSCRTRPMARCYVSRTRTQGCARDRPSGHSRVRAHSCIDIPPAVRQLCGNRSGRRTDFCCCRSNSCPVLEVARDINSRLRIGLDRKGLGGSPYDHLRARCVSINWIRCAAAIVPLIFGLGLCGAWPI